MKRLAIAMAFAFVGQAGAENLTGNELLSICDQADADLAQAGFCAGYVLGAVEGMKWGVSAPLLIAGDSTESAERSGNILLGFCLSPDATLGQYRDIAIKYLRENPAARHDSARSLIHIALREAFPCSLD